MKHAAEIERIIHEKLIFFNSLGKAVALIDTDFRVHACNPVFAGLYLGSEKLEKGDSFLEFICPEDWVSCRTQLEQLVSGEKETLKTEKRFKNEEGYLFWVGIVAKRWEINSKVFIFLLFDDVFPLRDAEKKLADSEIRYSKLIENLPVAVFHVNLLEPEPKVYFSKQFENLFHIRPGDFNESFIGLRKYIHAEDLLKFSHSHSDLQEDKNLIVTEFRLTNDLHQTFWVREHAQLIRNNNDKVIQIYGVMMDISKEVLAQKQLIKSEIKHQALIESANDRIGVFDTEGKLIYGNSHFFQSLGMEPEEYMAMPYLSHIHDDDHKKYREALREVQEKGKATYEYRVRHKKGHLLYMYSKLTLLKDEKGRVDGILSINRDITKLKKIEKELIQARQKAEESDRLKSAFLANMSHEIRTPLNGIIGFSKLLSNPEVAGNKRKMYSDIIERNSQQLLSLISDIIDIAKIESDQLKIHYEDMNLNDLLDEIFQIFRNEMNNYPDRDVKLYLQKDLYRDQSFVVADRFRLAQLFNNLLSNAVKFTNSGSIEFGYRYSGKDFLFFVKDTGIGILPEKQKIIFEPFRQEDDTMTRQYGGTGLGLAICSKLADLMGGKIWIESEKGVGSIFYFKLKIDFSKKTVVPKAPEIRTESAKWPGKTILIVDDNKDVLAYMNEILTDCEVRIIMAESGGEAIEICNWAEKIDLILMDIQMPGMDGYTATREIMKLHPDIPVVAQTAHAMAGDEIKCLRAGCAAYISKPIEKQKLQQVISAFL
ncbi:MAG: PAS domain-containing protein [Prolixibacteraceae bacterium]|jgi:PAS domain S-box-containing protein|nr:PAS domain-containing protein [Prolixibacteraceae bacterium]